MRSNIRKITALFLVLAAIMSVSSTAFVFAAENSISNVDYSHTLELFKKLGIIEDYDNFSDTKPITRGYFALVAARLFNIPFDGMAKEQRFTDVPMYSSYVDAIELLARNGVVSGDGEGIFRENDRIKAIDAAKMLTVIAGYGFIAENNGGYPKGYIAAANDAGILKNIGSVDDYLSAELMLVLVSNMLNASDIEITPGKDGVKYHKDPEKNLLKKIFDIDIIDGVVTQNSLTAFSSVSDIGKNKIEVTAGGEKYIIYTEEYGKYIGRKIKAFYTTDMNEEDMMVYAYPVSDKDAVKTVDISDIDLSASSETIVEYYDREAKRQRKAKGTAKPTVIYNMIYYSKAGVFDFGTELADKKGRVELIDNNSDGKYDVIIISAYDSFMVGNVLLDEQKVYSGGNAYGKLTSLVTPKQIDIDPENYDYFSMKYADGTEVTALDIVENQIMSVSQSSPGASKTAIDIIISRNIQSGKITAIDIDDEIPTKCYITLDARSPLVSTNDVVENFDLTLGKNASLYIDAFGNVVGATLISTGYYRYGLMLGNKLRRDDIKITLFTADNEVKEFETAKKFYIDDVKYTHPDAIKARLEVVSADIKTAQNISIDADPIKEGVYPIRYLVNDEGKLFKIDTPSKNKTQSEKDGLVIGESGEFASLYDYVLVEYNVSSPKSVPISKDATVIWMDLSGEPVTGTDNYSYENSRYDETSIEIDSASSLVSSYTNNNCYTYTLNDEGDKNSPYADLIMVIGKTSIAQDSYMLMVDKILQTYDEDESEVLPTLVGISQGGKKSITVSPSVKAEFESENLKRGDTIRFALDSRGYLDGFSVIARYGTKTVTSGAIPTTVEIADISDNYSGIQINTTNHKRWLYIGYVAERRGELLKILYKGKGQYELTPDIAEITGNNNMIYANPSASTPVTVYDRRLDRVFTGTFDDIKDYVHNGNEASRVIIRYDTGSLKEIMVYND